MVRLEPFQGGRPYLGGQAPYPSRLRLKQRPRQQRDYSYHTTPVALGDRWACAPQPLLRWGGEFPCNRPSFTTETSQSNLEQGKL